METVTISWWEKLKGRKGVLREVKEGPGRKMLLGTKF